jgi:hypothetical protein
MVGREQDEHVEVTPTEARSARPAYLSYVLAASLVLVVIGFVVAAMVALG